VAAAARAELPGSRRPGRGGRCQLASLTLIIAVQKSPV
jgi:hypothetical protein